MLLICFGSLVISLGDGCNILAFLSQYRYTAMYALLFVATLVQYFVTAGTSPG